MRPVLNLSRTFSQTVAETPACSRLRFAVFTLSLWHAKQFFERKGRTLLRYSGWLVSCAAILQQARAPNSAGSVCKFREMAATSTPNIHPLGYVRIQAAVKPCPGEAPDSRAVEADVSITSLHAILIDQAQISLVYESGAVECTYATFVLKSVLSDTLEIAVDDWNEFFKCLGITGAPAI